MRIKLTHQDTSKLLWRDSPCTLRNVIQNPSLDQATRFHYGSIYFKDEVNKPKKIFTEFERPELLLFNFRRQLEDVNLRSKKLSVHSSGPSHFSRNKKSKSTTPLENKLYERPTKLELRHDRFGNRSTYHGNFDVRELSERVRNSKRNFSSSRRIDLGRPENFYPGPGTYFPEDTHRSVPFRHTFTEKMRVTSLKNQ